MEQGSKALHVVIVPGSLEFIGRVFRSLDHAGTGFLV
jgi:hypothetical protein